MRHCSAHPANGERSGKLTDSVDQRAQWRYVPSPVVLQASEVLERGLNASRKVLKVGYLSHEIDRDSSSVVGRGVERT
jgi:hypothetical protein